MLGEGKALGYGSFSRILGSCGAEHAVPAGGHVSLLLERPAQAPETLQLTLAHPLEASRDRVLTLTRNSAGIYHGQAGGPIDGRYDVRLTPPDSTWRLTGRLPAGAESLQLDTRLGDRDS